MTAGAVIVLQRRSSLSRGEPLLRRVMETLLALPIDRRAVADNYSKDTTQDYFAEGMGRLTADLATISQLRVTSRGSAMQFKGKNRVSTPEIARILNVDALVEGSVVDWATRCASQRN